MGEYGPASPLVHQLIERARTLTFDEAADLFRARAMRTLVHGVEEERRAHLRATRAAAVTGRQEQYRTARHAAAVAWRSARCNTSGPWLSVSVAVANAAHALVVEDALEAKFFAMLFGPRQTALG